MNFFDETSQTKQPYAAVDSPPVLSWDEIDSALGENNDEHQRALAKLVYDHWKLRRLKAGNKSLIPSLKFETGADTDDGDPYICFRRREVRQVRKTRGRDAQSAEKLKKLRRELEDARQLIALVRQRELTRREQLNIDRALFEQRSDLRGVKKNLPDQYKDGDDDILINQKVGLRILPLVRMMLIQSKPQKKRPLEIATSQRSAATQLRLPPRPDGRQVEADLLNLSDVLADKENEINREISLKIAQHTKWNQGFVDMTSEPLTPLSEESMHTSFRTAITEYLPTPPASVSSEHSGDRLPEVGSPGQERHDPVTVRYASPTYDKPGRSQPSFRRRFGRGGRLMIDRRGMHLQSKEGLNDAIADRFKYDRDDDEEDETPTYLIDPYDISSMRYRAAIIGSSHSNAQMQAARRGQLEGSSVGAQGNKSQNHPQLPKHPPSD